MQIHLMPEAVISEPIGNNKQMMPDMVADRSATGVITADRSAAVM
jgi:hypothetical protein